MNVILKAISGMLIGGILGYVVSMISQGAGGG